MEPKSYQAEMVNFYREWVRFSSEMGRYILGQSARVADPAEADPAGLDHSNKLPVELLPLIFFHVFEARNQEGGKKGDITALALVCKKWKKGTEDVGLHKRIAQALDACGEDELQRLFAGTGQVNLGKIPPLPLWMCQHFKRKEGMLTLVPKTVVSTRKDGTSEEIPLNKLRNVGTLAGYAKTVHKVGFAPDSDQDALDQEMEHEETRWVWIKKEVIGKSYPYFLQLLLAQEQSDNGRAAMSKAVDTAMSLLMEQIRTGQRIVVLDPPLNATDVRVREIMQGCWSIHMAFTREGLLSVRKMGGFPSVCIGFFVARRSLDNQPLEVFGKKIYSKPTAVFD